MDWCQRVNLTEGKIESLFKSSFKICVEYSVEVRVERARWDSCKGEEGCCESTIESS